MKFIIWTKNRSPANQSPAGFQPNIEVVNVDEYHGPTSSRSTITINRKDWSLSNALENIQHLHVTEQAKVLRNVMTENRAQLETALMADLDT